MENAWLLVRRGKDERTFIAMEKKIEYNVNTGNLASWGKKMSFTMEKSMEKLDTISQIGY